MVRESFIKAQHSELLSDVAERLAELIQSDLWEERESVNYPNGHCFRRNFGPLEIVAQIANDTEYPDADFLIWIRKGEDSGGQMGVLTDRLVRNGYTVMAQP